VYCIILVVDCIFYLFLEWWMPRCDLDYVTEHWDQECFVKVSATIFLSPLCCFNKWFLSKARGQREEKACPPCYIGTETADVLTILCVGRIPISRGELHPPIVAFSLAQGLLGKVASERASSQMLFRTGPILGRWCARFRARNIVETDFGYGCG
jgi:hypothetical protein